MKAHSHLLKERERLQSQHPLGQNEIKRSYEPTTFFRNNNKKQYVPATPWPSSVL